MPHRVPRVMSFVLAMALLPSLASAQTAPTTGAAAAPQKMVDNPHFLAWSKHKPGTEVHLELRLDVAGQQMLTNITQKLIEVTPERAVVESVAKLNVPEVATQPQTQTHTFPAKVVESEAVKVAFPGGGEGESKEIGTEMIEAGGKTYACKVSEFTGKVQGAETKGKQWRTSDIPGGLVKMESLGAGMKVNLVATRVTEEK